MRLIRIVAVLLTLLSLSSGAGAGNLDLSGATVVVRGGERPAAEKAAATILTEEVARRTGLKWTVAAEWPARGTPIIALSTKAAPPAWADRIPAAALKSAALDRSEGFSIRVQQASAGEPAAIFVTGADPRGVMFGVGKLLRSLEWGPGAAALAAEFEAEQSPRVPIRGHQLGYRARANSWDAWAPAQFDQYIRELVVFGANSIENIPFEDSNSSVLMPISDRKSVV